MSINFLARDPEAVVRAQRIFRSDAQQVALDKNRRRIDPMLGGRAVSYDEFLAEHAANEMPVGPAYWSTLPFQAQGLRELLSDPRGAKAKRIAAEKSWEELEDEFKLFVEAAGDANSPPLVVETAEVADEAARSVPWPRQARPDVLEEAQVQAVLAVSLVEVPRSDAQRPGAKKGLRSKRSGGLSENFTTENSQVPHGCFDTNLRLDGAAGAERGVFGDITNVTAGRASQVDKAKPTKPTLWDSLQSPANTASRELPAVALAAPAPEMAPEEKVSGVLKDPQGLQEYVPDIINQLFSTETLTLPPADYMERQTAITGRMRMILIDWLIEVHMKYKLRQETLHLTVNLIDRYLSKKQMTRRQLQLVGVAAMLIASKYEEIKPPDLKDWVYITDNAYTKDEVLMMECDMLATVGFKIDVPTAAHFFEHLATTNASDAVHSTSCGPLPVRVCAQYLLELGLLDTRMLQYKPSHVVASAFLLSNELFRHCPTWPDAMIHQSRHSEHSLRHCTEELRQLWEADRAGAGDQLQAVHKKFSTSQYFSVATMRF